MFTATPFPIHISRELGRASNHYHPEEFTVLLTRLSLLLCIIPKMHFVLILLSFNSSSLVKASIQTLFTSLVYIHPTAELQQKYDLSFPKGYSVPLQIDPYLSSPVSFVRHSCLSMGHRTLWLLIYFHILVFGNSLQILRAGAMHYSTSVSTNIYPCVRNRVNTLHTCPELMD